VKLWGITSIRLRDGRVVEDHSVSDSVEFVSSLAVARCSQRSEFCAPGARAGSAASPTGDL
jgi:hypothetical protein